MCSNATTTQQAVKLSPIRTLECCVCGSEARGRQWYNRDKGYGICTKCVEWASKRESPEEMQEYYGTPNVHYFLPIPESPWTVVERVRQWLQTQPEDVQAQFLQHPDIFNYWKSDFRSWFSSGSKETVSDKACLQIIALSTALGGPARK